MSQDTEKANLSRHRVIQLLYINILYSFICIVHVISLTFKVQIKPLTNKTGVSPSFAEQDINNLLK